MMKKYDKIIPKGFDILGLIMRIYDEIISKGVIKLGM